MQRTPDEIKKGLEYLATRDVEKKCKLWQEGIAYAWQEDAAADALALIQQLEADNAQQARCIENLTDKLNAANDEMAKLQAEKDVLDYTLAGVMHSVDKWLDVEPFKIDGPTGNDAVTRAVLAREIALKAIEQAEAERDAAVEDLAHVKDCDTCKYDDACLTGKKDCFGCHEESCPCLHCKYEWRGVQKEG